MREYGPVDLVCDHYGEYVDHLNSLDAKQKKEQNDKKFQERVILNEKKDSGKSCCHSSKSTFNIC